MVGQLPVSDLVGEQVSAMGLQQPTIGCLEHSWLVVEQFGFQVRRNLVQTFLLNVADISSCFVSS